MIRVEPVFAPVSRDSSRRLYAISCTCHPDWGFEFSLSEVLFWPEEVARFGDPLVYVVDTANHLHARHPKDRARLFC